MTSRVVAACPVPMMTEARVSEGKRRQARTTSALFDPSDSRFRSLETTEAILAVVTLLLERQPIADAVQFLNPKLWLGSSI